MTIRRRPFFLLLVAGLSLSPAAPLFAQSGGYPTRAIRLVLPFPPGGGADLTARTLAQKMGESMGQPMVVDNRPGANGSIGTDAVAMAAPDGYTLLLTDRGSLGINPSLYARLPYDPLRDFSFIGIATDGPYVLVANPSLKLGSVADLVAAARSRPGAIQYASFGIGSMAQLNLEAFKQRAGIDLGHVPYKGAGPAAQAVVSGEVGITIASAPGVLGFIRDGRLRALAVGADRRLAQLPDVPTMTEAGVGANPLIPTFFALAAPAGTPAPIVTRLNAELSKALADPAVIERLGNAGLIPNGGSPEAMRDTVRSDIEHFGALVKSIGIQPE